MNYISDLHSRDAGMSLAEFVQLRRRQLKLAIAQAAQFAGMPFIDWCALESGWVPEEKGVLFLLCSTLMVNTDLLLTIATESRLQQGAA